MMKNRTLCVFNNLIQCTIRLLFTATGLLDELEDERPVLKQSQRKKCPSCHHNLSVLF